MHIGLQLNFDTNTYLMQRRDLRSIAKLNKIALKEIRIDSCAMNIYQFLILLSSSAHVNTRRFSEIHIVNKNLDENENATFDMNQLERHNISMSHPMTKEQTQILKETLETKLSEASAGFFLYFKSVKKEENQDNGQNEQGE